MSDNRLETICVTVCVIAFIVMMFLTVILYQWRH